MRIPCHAPTTRQLTYHAAGHGRGIHTVAVRQRARVACRHVHSAIFVNSFTKRLFLLFRHEIVPIKQKKTRIEHVSFLSFSRFPLFSTTQNDHTTPFLSPSLPLFFLPVPCSFRWAVQLRSASSSFCYVLHPSISSTVPTTSIEATTEQRPNNQPRTRSVSDNNKKGEEEKL